MASHGQRVSKGGMFGASNHAPLSRETQELMKVMMKESRLTNFQQRKLNEAMRDNKALPTKVPPTSSYREKEIIIQAPPPRSLTMRGKPLVAIRTKEAIEGSGAYEREKFVPKATRDLEKEKNRLSNFMAYGEDVKPPTKQQLLRQLREEMEVEYKEKDRFDEIQEEIEERKSFLETMRSVGRSGEYEAVISAQISQLVREMEAIDRERNAQLAARIKQAEQQQQS